MQKKVLQDLLSTISRSDWFFFPQGLVVLEATYGPTDEDEDARQLILDVTIPLQALVQHSQVYIPGHRTKVRFSDDMSAFSRFH